jgi:ankyrin repeat protein
MRTLFLSLAAVLAMRHSSAAPDPKTAAQNALQAMQKSVAVTEKVAQCNSCHHSTLPPLAYAIARSRGLEFSESLAQASENRSLQPLRSSELIGSGALLIDPSLNDGLQLLAARASGLPPSVLTTVMARRVASWQHPGGFWKSFDNRPPASVSPVTATALAAGGLAAYLPPAESEPRLAQARAWLKTTAAFNTEDLTFRLLGLYWTHAPAADIERAARDLTAAQRPDGSWGQTPSRPSDAYATGQALSALQITHTADAAVIQKGLQYLLQTQKADGTWHVPTRLHTYIPVSPPYFDTAFPYAKDQIMSMYGTTWSAMALMLSLPEKASALKVNPQWAFAAEPWMETVVHGSVADLEKALDGGLNPNTATPEGLSMLMLAASQPEKVQLLLRRGADAQARMKNGFTTVLVASSYGGSRPVLEALVNAGAPVMPQGKVMFNASPLVFASLGDRDALDFLIRHGGNPKKPMLLVGQVSASPAQMAATRGDVPMMQLLLDAGVPLVGGDGVPLLTFAAISNQADVVKLLLERGAQPDAADVFKVTARQHAASIEWDAPHAWAALR